MSLALQILPSHMLGKYRFSALAALLFCFIQNSKATTGNNEVIQDFKKFGLNINTLKNFPIEENGSTNTIDVIKELDEIQNNTAALKNLGLILFGTSYM